MINFKNEETVSLHITEKCNLSCKHCYIDNNKKNIDIEKVEIALRSINPKNILFYGGEPLLFPKILKKIMYDFPDKKFGVHTNGTILNTEILDKVDCIYLTIETFFFGHQNSWRPYSNIQWNNLKTILKKYKDKIRVIHNIYPTENDLSFFKIVTLSNMNYNTYPIILKNYIGEINYEDYKYLKPRTTFLTKPKLRILEDGTITRDMRGIYNICNYNEWKEEYRNYELPVSNKCLQCKYQKQCNFVNMFPHFCKDIIEYEKNEPYFCKVTKKLNESLF